MIVNPRMLNGRKPFYKRLGGLGLSEVEDFFLLISLKLSALMLHSVRGQYWILK